jgi:hypothetical protein
MDASGLRFEDKLDEVSNYSPWEERIMLVLVENDILEFSKFIVAPLVDPKDMAIHKIKDVKSKRIIIDRVKDHLIPRLSREKSIRDMWEVLKSLFQINNENQKNLLRENLKYLKMT